jgi:hypothetical protein
VLCLSGQVKEEKSGKEVMLWFYRISGGLDVMVTTSPLKEIALGNP